VTQRRVASGDGTEPTVKPDVGPNHAQAGEPSRKSRAVSRRVTTQRRTKAVARSTHRPEPDSEASLLRQAQRLSGRTIGEVAAELAVALPTEARRSKGFIGALIERALGASRGSAAGPDFAALGIELKTIPLSRAGRPRESTFVCTASLREIAAQEWHESAVRTKLARVLFVPIEAHAAAAFTDRRIGRPRLWSPTAEQEAQLRADFEELAGVIGRGEVELLTAHTGVVLQIRPKAAHSRERTRGTDDRGAALATLPRGFYLRASFTASLFADTL